MGSAPSKSTSSVLSPPSNSNIQSRPPAIPPKKVLRDNPGSRPIMSLPPIGLNYGATSKTVSISQLAPAMVAAKKYAQTKKEAVNQARKKMIEEYPELADAISFVDKTFEEIEKERERDTFKGTMSRKTLQSLTEIYDLYFEFDKAELRRILGDQMSKCNAAMTLTEYMKALTSDGENTPLSGYKFECLYMIRGVCWNFSDTSLELCREFGRMGLLSLVLKDLVAFKDSYKENGNKKFLILSGLSILHNCAKATDNKKYYRNGNAVEKILPYTKVSEQETKMIAVLTLAYIVEEENNHVISTNDSMIEYIIEYFKRAMSDNQGHSYEGFKAMELASGLMHLASNGENSVTIVNKGVLPILVELMKKGDDEEKAIATQSVWVLAFNNENKQKILEEENMMEVLRELSESENANVEKAASGAMWVLNTTKKIAKLVKTNVRNRESDDRENERTNKFFSQFPKAKKRGRGKIEEEEELQDRKTSSNNFFNDDSAYSEDEGNTVIEKTDDRSRNVTDVTKPPRHIMISYQWDCQKMLKKIKAKLVELGFRVWIDIDSMGGSTLQAMAEAVENAEVVLVCMSQKYKDSPNCRTEAEYAYSIKQAIIPLIMEQNYKPDGWLGAILGAKLFFDFSNLMHFEKTFVKLTKELGDRGKNADQGDGHIHPSSVKTLSALPSSEIPKPSIHPSQWKKEEVKEWVEKYGLTSPKLKALEGPAIVFLSELKCEAPDFFYRYASENLGIKDIFELMQFSRAIENLN